MERLTNKRETDAQREEYERRLANGYPRNIPEERFLRLAAYEDTGLTPEEINDLASVRTTMSVCANWPKPTRTGAWWYCRANQESMYLHCLMAKSVCGSVRSNTRFWTAGEKFSILYQLAAWETRIARHLGHLGNRIPNPRGGGESAGGDEEGG